MHQPLGKHELEQGLKNALRRFKNYHYDGRPIVIQSVNEFNFLEGQLHPEGATITDCTGGSCSVDAIINVADEEIQDGCFPKQASYHIPVVNFEVIEDNEGTREIVITNEELDIHTQ